MRNFFWSTAGQFDAIVGNRQVRWSNLEASQTNLLRKKYAGQVHGGNELDISAIITYPQLTVAGRMGDWCCHRRRCSVAFVEGLSAASMQPLVPISIDDMKVKRFPGGK